MHTDVLRDTVAIILAGGCGKRLWPLTRDRTKGAVPFGGMYRLIDFTLSNCLHSGIRHIIVLPQYKFASLDRHLRLGWNLWQPELGTSLSFVPPQQRVGKNWYRGTADAVYQNLYLLRRQKYQHALILSSDHIYHMDYSRLLAFHALHQAELTIACTEVERHEAHRFGIILRDRSKRVSGFVEKPVNADRAFSMQPFILASMGVYVFNAEAIDKVLTEDAYRRDSCHDFGHAIIPYMVQRKRAVYAYDVQQEEHQANFYWRDVGTIDAYWAASMDLLEDEPTFDLYGPGNAVHSYQQIRPPARINLEKSNKVTHSLICPGTVVTGARVHKSILFPGVRIDHEAQVTESILMDDVEVGTGARIHRAIVDKGVKIPTGFIVSPNYRNTFDVTSGQIVVVPKNAQFEHQIEHLHDGFSYFGSEDIPGDKREEQDSQAHDPASIHAL